MGEFETYRWRGVNPHGEQAAGQITCDPAALPTVVEARFQQGWRSLTVCRGPGPVPPPVTGPARIVAAIERSLDTGKRGWWAEKGEG
jgi:hypothetical protein